MRKNDGYTRCKKCGKVIVGNAKGGRCDSCFNDFVEKGGAVFIGSGIVYKIFKKPIDKFAKAIIRHFVKKHH
jgi:hypothetical protein